MRNFDFVFSLKTGNFLNHKEQEDLRTDIGVFYLSFVVGIPVPQTGAFVNIALFLVCKLFDE